jgi:hypothetical protein
MITMDYKDAGAWAAIFFAIAVLFGLIPVLWIGDLAIYTVNETNPNAPRIFYILAWLLSTSFYYFVVLERFVARTLLNNLNRDAQIVVYYLQGLFFGTILYYSNIKPAVSALPIQLLVKIFGGVWNWLMG